MKKRDVSIKRYGEYCRKMRDLADPDIDDFEVSHGTADDLLAEFVRELGYKKLAYLFGEVGKWYA